ncbi:SpoIIE family protein phosphatase [Mycobacterium heckeshornense]|uniref:SpoIIE family protein phosphatase n=1 Tax=Mycobacterium heckeshornense TaxID=110505 RepID=UPI001942C77B|nr:SpoIIE family protein phosphatase [Mycobacterium heckeshornense]
MREHGRLGPIEWAAAGRPRPGEQVCGDHQVAVELGDDAALFAVLDGLGHGTEAAAAALRAVQVLRGSPAEPLEALVRLCHHALADTRGVAMTLARIDFEAGVLHWTGVGNVAANLVAKAASGVDVRSSARLTGGIVGYRLPEIPPLQPVSIRPGDLLIIASDGIDENHFDSIDFAAPATTIAEQILDRHGKNTDDALVLAARHRGFPS